MSRRYDNSLEGPDNSWISDTKCGCCFISEDTSSSNDDEEDDSDGD